MDKNLHEKYFTMTITFANLKIVNFLLLAFDTFLVFSKILWQYRRIISV